MQILILIILKRLLFENDNVEAKISPKKEENTDTQQVNLSVQPVASSPALQNTAPTLTQESFDSNAQEQNSG